MREYYNFLTLLIILSFFLSGRTFCNEKNLETPISVFGTDAISSEDIASGYSDVLNELIKLYNEDREKYHLKRSEIEDDFKTKLDLCYSSLNLFKSYVGNFYFIFDFVTRSDSSSRLKFREISNVSYSDPDNLIAKWNEYENRSFELFNAGEINNTDCPIYHCIWGYDHPELYPYFEYFEEFVPKNKNALIEILNSADSAEFRANAVFLLAHLDDSANELMSILETGINDPNTRVRNNSMRVIYYLVKENPELDLDLDLVVRAINYPSNYDRNKAIVILRSISPDRLTPLQIKKCLPVLLKCIIDNDNNASNAYKVLTKVSGEQFSISDIDKWRTWCDNYSDR